MVQHQKNLWNQRKTENQVSWEVRETFVARCATNERFTGHQSDKFVRICCDPSRLTSYVITATIWVSRRVAIGVHMRYLTRQWGRNPPLFIQSQCITPKSTCPHNCLSCWYTRRKWYGKSHFFRSTAFLFRAFR